MRKQARAFRAEAGATKVRTATLEGREHLVVPVVALVEGVIHASNSESPELVLAEEFGKVPQAWDGRPVMLDHPELHGEKTSANQPKVLEKWRLGYVFNSKVEDRKLKLEAWVDPERAEAVGEEAVALLEAVRGGQIIEVSVGVFVQTEEESGVRDGRRYAGVWREVIPDHLALLPAGKEGACSVEMGCGAPRANEGGRVMLVRTAGSVPKNVSGKLAPRDEAWAAPTLSDFTDESWGDLTDAQKNKIAGHFAWTANSPPESFGDLKLPHHRASDGAVVFRGCSAAMGRLNQSDIDNKDAVRAHLQSHMDAFEAKQAARGWFAGLLERFTEKFRPAEEGTSDVDLRSMLEQALHATEPAFLGVVEAFPEEKLVVYATAPEGDMLFWRRSYAVEGDKVTLDKDKVQVVQKTTYEPVTASAAPSGCGGQVTPPAPAPSAKEDEMKTKKERVAAIIASGKTCFKAEQATVLEAADEALIKHLEDNITKASETPAPTTPPPAEPAKETPPPAEPVKPEEEQAAFLAKHPDIAEIVSSHKAAQAAEKASLVEKLKVAQKSYTEDELKAMPVPALKKLASAIIKEKVDYAPAGGGQPDSQDKLPTSEDLRANMKAKVLALRGVKKTA